LARWPVEKIMGASSKEPKEEQAPNDTKTQEAKA